jgi:hypothetical protein
VLSTFDTKESIRVHAILGRTATAAVVALVLQACETASPTQSSLDDYAFPLSVDEIPAVVREDAHPAPTFSHDLPASRFEALETESVEGTGQQYWTDPRITRWRRETVYQAGAFRVERVSADNGLNGYHAFYGPVQTNVYEWRGNGAWRAFRLTDLTNVENPDCAADIEPIDGFDPRQLCWSFDWEGDWAVGDRRGRRDNSTSLRVTGTTDVTVNVNGSDYMLPAYTVVRSHSAWTAGSEVELAYVPALGEFVQWDGKRVGRGDVPRWSGHVLSAQVSDEVLEEVKATAVR